MTIPGSPPPTLRELARAQDERGTVHIPAATISVVLLGPGTRITHQAVVLLAQSGATAVWVGEQGVRYYAHGRSLARSTRLLEAQALKVTNRNLRLAVAREMYAMRFPGEDTSALTMQQLRGREGARVRKTYRQHAQRTGITWNRRDYDPDNFTGSDPINQALSAANTALYGVVHAVIVALGCSAGLGFIHTGHERSFVYDIADLYKAESTIPTAFDVIADDPCDIAAQTRRAMRDKMHQASFLDRCVTDIRHLLLPDEPLDTTDTAESIDPSEADHWDEDTVKLWHESGDSLDGGVNYADEVDF